MSRYKPLNIKNIVPIDRCTDTPSKLFRLIADQILGPEKDTNGDAKRMAIWKTYIDDYIRKLHPDDPKNMDTVKKERSTAIGNINDTLWMSDRLSFGKMLTGLGIMKGRKVTITISIETDSGRTYTAQEVTTIPSVQAKTK